MANKKAKKSDEHYRWGDIADFSKGEEYVAIEKKRSWNLVFLYALVFISLGILVARMFELQVIKGEEYASRAQSNNIKEEVINPERGVIFDKNGTQLVQNKSLFSLAINVKDAPRIISEDEWEKMFSEIYEDEDLTQVKSGFTLAGLNLPKLTEDGDRYFNFVSQATGIDKKEIVLKFVEGVGINNQKKIVLVKGVSVDQQINIKSQLENFEGLEIISISDRYYPYEDIFTHVIGYTGEISEEDLEFTDEYDQGDIVGRTGLELIYEDDLFGVKGIRLIEQNARGETINDLESSQIAPIPGNNLYLSIDLEVQQKLQELVEAGVTKYGATGGAAIVEEVETGEIIAMVSLPSYNPNLFIGGISYDDYNALNTDENLPLYNRAISTAVAPGSTYKTLVASAALEEGAIEADTYFVSTGVMYLGNQPFPEYGRKAWGRINMIDGLAYSSNHYFCNTMLELGMSNFTPYAEWAGFGEKTGIDLSSEARGVIPSPEKKLELASTRPWLEQTWGDGDTCNSAIGQGITLVTPIQMVNWAATIGNGGTVLRPHIVSEVRDQEGEVIESFGRIVENEPKVSEEHLNSVKQGMRETVLRRIVWPLDGAKVNVAAKTGTAQFGSRSGGTYTQNHAWVITIFPYEDPKYSMVVFLEAGDASNNSAQVAREFIDWFVEYEGSDL